MESSPDQCKSQEMCAKSFERKPKMLDNFNNDDLITWRNVCKQCKTWEKQIDKDLLPMTWDPF